MKKLKIILLFLLASCSDNSTTIDCDCQLKTTYFEEVTNVFGEQVIVSYSEYSDYGTTCSLDGVIIEDSPDVFSIVECTNIN